MPRSKYTAKQKYEILKEYENGFETIKKIITKYNISRFTFNNWRNKYKRNGIDGLKESRTWKRYSKKVKLQAVKDYLSGKYSLYNVVEKYNISDKKVVQQWVMKYNSHREELKGTSKGRNKSMTKGRSTTWKERIEIVLDCIAKNNNYGQAAEEHNVSYQQVYQWVRKYKSGGIKALKDRRGRKKSTEELTPEDKIKIEMKKLQMENEKLKAENDFLKKLEELERRRF